MIHYVIDGNNVIGKIGELKFLQKKDPQSAREKLAHRLDRYFGKKKFKVTLHFDGPRREPIRTNKIKIVYSEEQTADEMMRLQIENAENRKLLKVISSDRYISDFAKACSCDTLKSEEFAKELLSHDKSQSEEDIIKDMSDDEFKKLFGVD